MAANWLKLNDSKTEFIIFGSQKNLSLVASSSIVIGESAIGPSSCVKNIGAHLDAQLRLDKQVAATCRAAWFQLYQVSKIRGYLTQEQASLCMLMLHAD